MARHITASGFCTVPGVTLDGDEHFGSEGRQSFRRFNSMIRRPHRNKALLFVPRTAVTIFDAYSVLLFYIIMSVLSHISRLCLFKFFNVIL